MQFKHKFHNQKPLTLVIFSFQEMIINLRQETPSALIKQCEEAASKCGVKCSVQQQCGSLKIEGTQSSLLSSVKAINEMLASQIKQVILKYAFIALYKYLEYCKAFIL